MRRDFLLKPELLRAISDLGFEHPSEGTFLPLVLVELADAQCNKSAFPRLSSELMSCVKPSPVWVKPPFSCSPPSSKCAFSPPHLDEC